MGGGVLVDLRGYSSRASRDYSTTPGSDCLERDGKFSFSPEKMYGKIAISLTINYGENYITRTAEVFNRLKKIMENPQERGNRGNEFSLPSWFFFTKSSTFLPFREQ